MKKLFLFAALTLSVGLWATTQKVSYRYPVCIDNDATKGIQEWKTGEVEAIVVEFAPLSVTWNAGWYVVTGEDVQLVQGAVCNGDVHLILADGAKLTATGGNSQTGIQVSGEGNSLTIYGQANQSGQLIATGGYDASGIGGGNGQDGSNITINGGMVTANGGYMGAGIGGGRHGAGSNIIINGGKVTATGGSNGAGIGGGESGNGSNITINGGEVTANYSAPNGAGIGGGGGGKGFDITINGGKVIATGGDYAAGIGGGYKGSGSNITITNGDVTATGGDNGAGIGGGIMGDGSNITFNGGVVTANGGKYAAGIGGGKQGSGSNIKVATYLIVKAGGTENPTEEIATDRTDDTDIASSLAGKRYVTTKADPWKLAIAEIEAAVKGVTDADILAIANKAKEDINAATTVEEVNTIKTQALAELAIPIKIYNSGKAAGLAEAAAALPTDPEGTTGHAVVITKGDKSVTLINPESVSYIKQE